MTTTYTNTRRPVLMKWMMYICIICTVGCFIFDAFFPDWPDTYFIKNPTFFVFVFGYGAYFFKHYKLQTITIDEENGVLIDSHHKDNPLKISDITIVKYKRTHRGRYRCLYIHDDCVRFFDIYTSRYTAVRIRHHLLKLNPNIKS